MSLPIDEVMPAVLAHLSAENFLLLQSPPGSGKTTRVPVALLDAPWLAGQRLLLVQPRRLAARSVAEFIASARGETVGNTVGYRTREETRLSDRTRIEVVTDGVLVRLLQNDPELAGYGAVILDEFHERSVLSDLAFALLQDVCQTLRDDLRILLMSATLGNVAQHPRLAAYQPIVAEGRLHPVAIHYRPPATRQPWLDHVIQVTAEQMQAFPEESLLVFLPGKPELRWVMEALQQRFPQDVLLPLHGDLALAEQARVIAPVASGRKVVLATAIAETSLTLEGIHRVIDSGYGRYSRHDPDTGMTRLITQRISHASAEQRAGRAGRLGPGTCVRLWPESERLAAQNTPPILQADPLPLVLAAARWGARHNTDLAWLDVPHSGLWQQAVELLRQWRALDEQGGLTALGQHVADTPAEPRVALMIERCRHQAPALLPLVLAVAATFASRDTGPSSGADFMVRLQVNLQHKPGAFYREWTRLLRQFSVAGQVGAVDEYALALRVAEAFPERLARLRHQGEGRYQLASGKGAVLDGADSLAGSEWLLVLAMQAERSDGRIYSALKLRGEDVISHFADQIESHDNLHWDSRQQRLVASRIRTLGRLVIDQQPLADISPSHRSQVLAELVQRDGFTLFRWSEAARNLCQAIGAARQAGVLEGEWPDFSEPGLRADCATWLIPFCSTATRAADFAQLDLHPLLLGRLDHHQRHWLQTHLPATFTVPTGRQVPIHYREDGSAWFEVKLQEMFGLQQLPRLGRGAISLQAHLLSPAGRPVAITADIAYFWHNVYPSVRKELRGRYPKHPWPEDPLTAPPEAGVKRRRH